MRITMFTSHNEPEMVVSKTSKTNAKDEIEDAMGK